MFQKSSLICSFLLSALILMPGVSVAQSPLGSAFMYQGRLDDGNVPAQGEFDFRFDLHTDAVADSLIGSITFENVLVSDGLFTVELDYRASAFDGDARWLEVAVRPGGDTGAYMPLMPRQALTATPYALHALTSNEASSLEGYSAGEFSLAAHVHDASEITTGVLPDARVTDALTVSAAGSVAGAAIKTGMIAQARIDAAIARDSEILPTVLANDGPGSTLDADTLDGLDSSEFMSAATDEWVNTTGDAMTGPLTITSASEQTLLTLNSSFPGNGSAAVSGIASASGAVTNYGGYFYAGGNSARAVYGEGASTSGATNYGGYFLARGTGVAVSMAEGTLQVVTSRTLMVLVTEFTLRSLVRVRGEVWRLFHYKRLG